MLSAAQKGLLVGLVNLVVHHGQVIAPFTIVYETFGELDAARSNAILVCHALSPGAHAAGKYAAGGTA